MFERIFSADTFWWILMILYVPSCIGLIVIVLLQKGKGTSFAGAFGMGPGGDAVFGPKTGRSLPVRMTYVAATFFMVIALVMSILAGRVGKGVAPDLVEETEAAAAAASSELLDLGIGTGEEGVGKAGAGAAATPDSGPTSDPSEAAVSTPEPGPSSDSADGASSGDPPS